MIKIYDDDFLIKLYYKKQFCYFCLDDKKEIIGNKTIVFCFDGLNEKLPACDSCYQEKKEFSECRVEYCVLMQMKRPTELFEHRIMISLIFTQTINRQQNLKDIKIPDNYLPILHQDSSRLYFIKIRLPNLMNETHRL